MFAGETPPFFMVKSPRVHPEKPWFLAIPFETRTRRPRPNDAAAVKAPAGSGVPMEIMEDPEITP